MADIDGEGVVVADHGFDEPVGVEVSPAQRRAKLMTDTGTKLHARTDGGGTEFWAVSYADHETLMKALADDAHGLEMIEDRLHFLGKYVRPE